MKAKISMSRTRTHPPSGRVCRFRYHPEALLEGDVTAGGSEMEEPKQTEAKNHQPPKSNRSRSRQPKPLPDQTEKDGKKGGSQPSHKQVTVEPEPEPVPMEASDGQT